MSLSLFVRKAVVCAALAVVSPGLTFAENYTTNGGQYAIAGAMARDQAHPALALHPNGGVLVWDDNQTDGFGLGIGYTRLDSGLSGTFSPSRVNVTTADDQEKPSVTLLQDGGAAFVWQGGKLGFQHVYARFMAADGTFRTGEVLVSSPNAEFQTEQVVKTLANGNVVVVYSSQNQYSAASMKDVYGQVFTPTGEKVGAEFLVNQTVAFNQRSPGVAPLANGGFVVVWISEQQRKNTENPSPGQVYTSGNVPSVDLYVRTFSGTGSPSGNEALVNTLSYVCANPTVASDSAGYVVAWSERDMKNLQYGWDIMARRFSIAGAPGPVRKVNSREIGHQYGPQLASSSHAYLVVWNSLGQDSSMEGVYGKFLALDGSLSGEEFRVNTTTASGQIHPTVASDQRDRFLVSWASFTSLTSSYDIYSQSYILDAQPLDPMDAPFVYAPFEVSNGSYVPKVQLSWAPQPMADHYNIYVDGSATPVASVQSNIWWSVGLETAKTYWSAVAFVTADGRVSPISAPCSITTWNGYNWGGIPFEWMSAQYGNDFSLWPPANTRLTPNGPTVSDVFISGGTVNNPASWLRTEIVMAESGPQLKWNSQPGRIYQIQTSTDMLKWTDVGGKRFAPSNEDATPVQHGNAAYYRVVLMR